MAAMPIHGKNLKKSSCPKLLSQLPWNLVYIAFVDLVLQSIYKWWLWINHDLFYGKVKFLNEK